MFWLASFVLLCMAALPIEAVSGSRLKIKLWPTALQCILVLALLLCGSAAHAGAANRLKLSVFHSLPLAMLPNDGGATNFAYYLEADFPAQGNPADPGYSAYPVANFDQPINQTVSDPIWKFAVVVGKGPTDAQYAAGVRNAITDVRCNLNGGSWAVNTTPSDNDQTGITRYAGEAVYTFGVDTAQFSDGLKQIRCVVTPMTGKPLIMQGEPWLFRGTATSGSNVVNVAFTWQGSPKIGQFLIGNSIDNYSASTTLPSSGTTGTFEMNSNASGSPGLQYYSSPLRYQSVMSLWVNLNRGGTLPGGFAWVDPVGGSDANSCLTTTEVAPPVIATGFCATVNQALAQMRTAPGHSGGDVGGGTIELNAGDYSITSEAAETPAATQYLRIKSAPGVARDTVRIVAAAGNRLYTQKLYWDNVTLYLQPGVAVGANVGQTRLPMTWLRNVKYTCQYQTIGPSAWCGQYADFITESTLEYVGDMTAYMWRNTTINFNKGDGFTSARAVLQSTIKNMIGYPLGVNIHADVYQLRVGHPPNNLVFKLQATEEIDSQVLFSDGNPPATQTAIIGSAVNNRPLGNHGFYGFQYGGVGTNGFFVWGTSIVSTAPKFNSQGPFSTVYTVYQDNVSACPTYDPEVVRPTGIIYNGLNSACSP